MKKKYILLLVLLFSGFGLAKIIVPNITWEQTDPTDSVVTAWYCDAKADVKNAEALRVMLGSDKLKFTQGTNEHVGVCFEFKQPYQDYISKVSLWLDNSVVFYTDNGFFKKGVKTERGNAIRSPWLYVDGVGRTHTDEIDFETTNPLSVGAHSVKLKAEFPSSSATGLSTEIVEALKNGILVEGAGGVSKFEVVSASGLVVSIDVPAEIKVGVEAKFTAKVTSGTVPAGAVYEWKVDDKVVSGQATTELKQKWDKAGSYKIVFTIKNTAGTVLAIAEKTISVGEPVKPAASILDALARIDKKLVEAFSK